MISTPLNVFLVTIPLLCGSGRAAEIQVNWRDLSTAPKAVTAGRGDTVVIDWAGTTNVQEVATKAEFDKCDGVFSVGRSGTRSPTKLSVPVTAADNDKFYYFSTVKDQCTKGKRLIVTVSGGDTLDDSGTCAAVACRKDNDHNKGFKLDHECCATLGNAYYREEAACATGYTYYQHKSDKCKPLGDPPNQLVRTATCCVRDGANAPSGASRPTSPSPASPSSTAASPGSNPTDSARRARLNAALPLFAGAVFCVVNTVVNTV